MKLLWGLLLVVALIEGNHALVVPDTFLDLDGGLSGVYSNYLDDMSTLNSTFSRLIDLNVSPEIAESSSSCMSILNDIAQCTGSLEDVRNDFLIRIPGYFDILNERFGSLSDAVGPVVQNIFNQQLNLLQNSIYNALSSITENFAETVVDLLNNVQYLLLTFDIIIILLAQSINDQFTNFIFNTLIVCDMTFMIKEFVLFLNAPNVNDPIASSYLSTFLGTGTKGVGFVAQDIFDNVSDADSQSLLTGNAIAAGYRFVNLTFGFMTADSVIPSVFASSIFTAQSPSDQLAQIEVALNNLDSPIGIYSGAEIYQIITSALSN